MSALFFIFILALLIFMSGYFSASETALFSLSNAKLKAFRTDPNPRKKLIASLLQHPRDLLVTVFMINTLVNILLQNVASHLFGSSAGWLWKVGFPLTLTLIFGEIIPKYIGMQNNVSVSYHVAPLITFFQNSLKPLRKLIVCITAPVSRFLFFFLKKEKNISKEELQHVLRTSELHGVLNENEADIVWGYLNLQDSIVKEFMRPREDILYYDIEEPLTKLTHLFVDRHYSRVPVCEGDLQNIRGVITSRTFFINKTNLNSQENLFEHLSRPYYIPENTLAHVLLHRFEKEGMHFAIVVDEYGTVSGIITREDLLEVVIGKTSESDEEEALFAHAGKNEIIANGKLELNSFNDIFSTDLTSPNNMVTIGGWLMERIGEIPKNGEKFEFEGFLFHVLAADPNKVKRLYVRKIKEPNQSKQRSS